MNKRSTRDHEAMPPGEVKPIAEIEIGPTKHEKFLDQNYRKMILGLIIVILLATGFIVYNVVRDEQGREGGAALVDAMSATGESRLDRLAAVTANYTGSNSATTAEYLRSMTLWGMGRKDEANTIMEDFQAKAPTREWKTQASVVLGCRYMQEGRSDDAIRYFEEVRADSTSLYAPFAVLSLGDIAAQKGDQEQARALYQEARERYPASLFVLQETWLFPGLEPREKLIGVTAPVRVQPETSQGPAPAEAQTPGNFELPGSSSELMGE